MSLLTPPRRYDPEILEDPTVDDRLVVRSIRDVVRSNTVFGGASAMVAEIERHFPRLAATASLLDVGTGLGDIPWKARRAAARRGIDLQTIGLDAEEVLVRHARPRLTYGVRGDALALPFDTRSIDIVTCSQVLHHFRGEEACALLREMNRVARVAAVVSDIRRSWIAAGGFWAASWPLGFHSITRHDGVVSVFRGFTPDELRETLCDAIGTPIPVRRQLGFRVTASWTPV